MRMSMQSRKEFLWKMRNLYVKEKSRPEKSRIIDTVVDTMDYHRKHAIQVLNGKTSVLKPTLCRRHRPLQYQEASPVIQKVWQALDYPCAERLQPVLLSTAEHLESHHEVTLTEEIREQLAQISRSTLARRIARWQSPKYKQRNYSQARATYRLSNQVPVETYAWDEKKPGALQVDLVEHNGGSSLGHFAYTLSVVDVVSGFSLRRAVHGKSQRVVLGALGKIINQWPHRVWGLHIDNGQEFLNQQLLTFCKEQNIKFTRSRPYRKNDNAHVEQKNRQYVREYVGYQRYDTENDVGWLNEVYGLLDQYANFFLPMRKVVKKKRQGAKLQKKYDQAKTPYDRLVELGAISSIKKEVMDKRRQALNPMDLHNRLEALMSQGPAIGETCVR